MTMLLIPGPYSHSQRLSDRVGGLMFNKEERHRVPLAVVVDHTDDEHGYVPHGGLVGGVHTHNTLAVLEQHLALAPCLVEQ